MNSRLKALKLGDTVSARVSEVLRSGDIIASFGGELLRVYNRTGRKFALNQEVTLEVKAVNPLAFQLYVQRRRHDKINFVV